MTQIIAPRAQNIHESLAGAAAALKLNARIVTTITTEPDAQDIEITDLESRSDDKDAQIAELKREIWLLNATKNAQIKALENKLFWAETHLSRYQAKAAKPLREMSDLRRYQLLATGGYVAGCPLPTLDTLNEQIIRGAVVAQVPSIRA
jgi:chromosome segregation ATPase